MSVELQKSNTFNGPEVTIEKYMYWNGASGG